MSLLAGSKRERARGHGDARLAAFTDAAAPVEVAYLADASVRSCGLCAAHASHALAAAPAPSQMVPNCAVAVAIDIHALALLSVVVVAVPAVRRLLAATGRL
jgi:hypothetical protein